MKLRLRARLGVPIAFVLLCAGPSLPAAGAKPRALAIQDLGTFNEIESYGISLNNRGQIVGVALVGPGEIRSFLWEAGTMIDLDAGDLAARDINDRGQILFQQFIANPDDRNSCFLRDGGITLGPMNPGGTQCHANDLNNRGQAVGSLGTGESRILDTSAFLWESGTMTDLGSLGGGWAVALAINDRGQVVGGSTTGRFGDEHAFLWEAGVMTDLGAPGASWSRAYAINNRGQVVVQSGAHVYLWERGTLTDLGTFGGDEAPPQITYPIDINERGQILVAVYDVSEGEFRWGVWEDGIVTWLPSLGSGVPSGNRLNSRGQVVGSDRSDAAGTPHVVLWTPASASGRGDP